MSHRKKKQNYNEVIFNCPHSVCFIYHSKFKHSRRKIFLLTLEFCCAKIVLRTLTQLYGINDSKMPKFSGIFQLWLSHVVIWKLDLLFCYDFISLSKCLSIFAVHFSCKMKQSTVLPARLHCIRDFIVSDALSFLLADASRGKDQQQFHAYAKDLNLPSISVLCQYFYLIRDFWKPITEFENKLQFLLSCNAFH